MENSDNAEHTENAEKTEHLRSLETEQPPLTVLHTYINRKQRDPGALKDALDSGGYFFPTNPQSSDELQNLLANSLGDVARERRCTTAQLLADEKVSYTLRSLGCSIEGSRIVVRGGVEGGLGRSGVSGGRAAIICASRWAAAVKSSCLGITGDASDSTGAAAATGLVAPPSTLIWMASTTSSW
jgi:hypothetical protein